MPSARVRRALGDLGMTARDPLLLTVIVAVLAALIVFILYPLVCVVLTSFRAPTGYSLRAFGEALSSRYIWRAFGNSMLMGALTAVLGSAVGFLFAFTIARTDIPFKKLLHLIAIVPVVSPPFIGALSIIMLFGNSGLVTYSLLGLKNFPIYGFRGLLLAQLITFFPVAYITLRGVIESINPTLEDAALDLGGSRVKVFVKVTLPLAIPGIASSMLVLFIETLADFGNPLFLAGSQFPILSVQAYLQIVGMYDLPKGAALALVLLVPSITAYVLQKYWVSRKQYVTVTGKPTASSPKLVNPAGKWALFAICLMLAGLILLIYLTIMWGAIARVWGTNNTPTLDHFFYVFSVGFKAVLDTLLIAWVSTPIAGVLGMVIAFLVIRKRFPGRHFMEFTSMLSFAVPGTVIGIGYIIAFNRAPLILTGTLLILLLNFIFRYIPVGVESGVAILRQVDPSIEEAAVDLGADSRRTFSLVTLPLMVPAFFSGLIYSFARAMTAVSAAIFLVSSRWNLMTVQIMSQADSGRLGAAAAFSVILVLLVLAAILIIRALLLFRYGRRGGSILKI